jgi:hypothetical protein
MDSRPIDVRVNLSTDEFVREYIAKNRPVIVADATKEWAARNWSIEFFEQMLAHELIDVTDDGPFPVGRMPFAEFAQHVRVAAVETPSADGSIEHLRYFRFRGQPALERVRDQWRRPYFMPERIYGYAEDLIKRREEYPAFGIFISPRGAASKLHVDGNRTNALITQLCGVKRCFLISPEDGRRLPPVQERVKKKARHLAVQRPDFHGIRPLEFDVNPGETLIVPHSWFHEVHTLSTSISLTYNFFLLRDIPKVAAWMVMNRLFNPRALDVG